MGSLLIDLEIRTVHLASISKILRSCPRLERLVVDCCLTEAMYGERVSDLEQACLTSPVRTLFLHVHDSQMALTLLKLRQLTTVTLGNHDYQPIGKYIKVIATNPSIRTVSIFRGYATASAMAELFEIETLEEISFPCNAYFVGEALNPLIANSIRELCEQMVDTWPALEHLHRQVVKDPDLHGYTIHRNPDWIKFESRGHATVG